MTSSDPAIVVQKYGGSSVADFERLKRVAERVVGTVREGKRVVVVVSAMGRTTDELLRLAHSAASKPSRREMDMLLSAGERIASALLAMAIEDLGQPAISFTGSQCGIITTHRHTNARILEVRPYRVVDELDDDRVVIIAGFQGVSYKREVTTLSRGGSDTTAVAMAAALGAEYCEICSDVDGVYTGDPALIDAPRHLPQLGYDEMEQLARYGAKVLAAEAVEYARRAGIAIHARASGGSERCTVVAAAGAASPVLAVTGIANLALVSADGGAASLGALSEVLERHETAPLWARLVGGQPSVLLVRGRCPDYGALREALSAAVPGTRIEEGLDAVTLVGDALDSSPGRIARVLAILGAGGLEVLGMDAGARRLTALLPAGSLREAQRALHEALVTGK